jgi:hypothetical protein
MIAQRAFLSGRVSGVCIVVTATAAFFGSVVSGQAQVDPNIQTQANILSAPLTTVPLVPVQPVTEISKTHAEALKKIGITGPCPPTKEQVKAAVDQVVHESKANDPRFNMEALEKASTLQILTLFKPKEMARVKFLATPPNFLYCHGQPTNLRASLIVNPTYETNALKTGVNGSPDESFAAGGSVLVTAGLGDKRPYDLIFLNMQTDSSRYATYSAKGIDTFTAQAGYQYLIDAYNYKDGNALPINLGNVPGNKAVTYDTVSFGFLNQTTYEPNFRKGTADLFTPQVTLGRQNFDLADPKGPLCSPSSDWSKPTLATPKPDPRSNLNFCYYLDLALTLGQSFSDVPTLQNANAAISATVGHRLNGTDWTLAAQTIVTSRSYENVPGGRQDYLVQVGPVFNYNHAPIPTALGNLSFAFTLPVNYYQNYSSVSKNAWSGLIVQPTFTLAFSPTAPVK